MKSTHIGMKTSPCPALSAAEILPLLAHQQPTCSHQGEEGTPRKHMIIGRQNERWRWPCTSFETVPLEEQSPRKPTGKSIREIKVAYENHECFSN